MSNQIKCPKCNQVTNQMIDHLPLEFKTMPFDDQLFTTFQCLQVGCHHSFKSVLNLSVLEEDTSPDSLMIVINKEIPYSVLENVFVTAFEGGSNYWYFLPDKSIEAIRAAVPKSVDPYLSTAAAKAVFYHGVEIALNDAEDEEEELGVISKKTMAERIAKLANEEPRFFEAEMSESGDATSSDIWFQYMAFNEIVYG